MSEHRTDPTALTALLSLADADHLLTASGIRAPAIRMAKDGVILPTSEFSASATLAGQPVTGLVDARKALALFESGTTIVFQGLHRYWPPLTRLIASLERELGHPCQANAYLTPPSAQGFATHSDTHDVFVFQTSGRKAWTIDDRDVILEPGLVMYLPTGTPHSARAQDEISLHVTIGINQVTMRGLVRRSVEAALADVPATHLPAGYLDDPAPLAHALGAELRALAERIRAIDPAQVVEDGCARFLTQRPSRLEGGLLDLAALASLTDHSPLRRRAGHPCELRPHDDRIEVLLGDRTLTVPAWLEPALRFIASHPSLTPGDLSAHLDAESRIVLCRRLVREGLLQVV